MTKFIIRNDDVGTDTNLAKLKKFCEICDNYGYKIIQAITPIGTCGKYARSHLTNDQIRLLSFKKLEENEELINYLRNRNDLIAVHGLWHTHEPPESEIAIAKSILEGLGLTPTYFVPPFNEGDYPETVVGLTTCQLDLNKGELLETFLKAGTPTAPIMYLHSWRFDRNYKFDDLDKCLARLSKETNQDQTIVENNNAYFSNPKNVRQYTLEEGLRNIERDLISEFMPKPPAQLIDLGCGGGRTSGSLAKAGYAVTAIDLSQPLIERARERYPGLDFRIMNAAALEFPNKSFDAALFSFNGIDGLFPLTDRLRCLAEVWRVLKPGGVFIMSTHNLLGHVFGGGSDRDNFKNIIRIVTAQKQNPHLYDWYVKYDAYGGPQFLFSAPPSTTRDQLVSAGFEILDIRGKTGSSENHIFWHEPHVTFIAKKSGS